MVSEFQANEKEFSVNKTINTLIEKLEVKSNHLEKKYLPLKFIFLINNIFFVLSKIKKADLFKYLDKNLPNLINDKIKHYTKSYLECTWKKVVTEALNEKENKSIIVYETDGKKLKNSCRELIKKKFSVR